MKKNSLLLLLCLLMGGATMAQNVKRPDNYNYKRGIEAAQNGQLDEAVEYFNKDIQENPKNGYSYSWIATLRLNSEDYGRALTAADLAIKYLPKKDTEYLSSTYETRAKIYLNLEDTVKAISDFTTAIKLDPEDEDLYGNRAQIYYEQEKYDLADADYRKMIALKPGSVMGYMGIGRNANSQKRWNEAIEQFDHVLKLESKYSSGYSFRAESYLGLEDWDKATDDLVSAMELRMDGKVSYLISSIKEPAFTMLVTKMKLKSAKTPNNPMWPYIIGTMYEDAKLYEKAIEFYSLANSKDVSDFTYYRISNCQQELGAYEEALSSINQAINMDSTDLLYLGHIANLHYEMGDVAAGIAGWDKVLEIDPEYAFGYYRRGWFKELGNDLDGAIEDLTTSIVLQPKYSYAYASRGDVNTKQGKKELAEADYKKVIELEDAPSKYNCIQYAYIALGERDKAIAAMDSIIARDTADAGTYYDAACVYARLQDTTKALFYLEKTLELGFKRFAHIERDDDMDMLRETEAYKELMAKYKFPTQNSKTSADGTTPSDKEPQTTEIPFTKEDGICKVQCTINGLPLHFVFDTGASDVTVSMVEATFMMKNGYLNNSDVIGSQHYTDANGNVSVGTVINLKNVNFGGLELTNVRASVVRNQKAPLLLGQSVLGRLGKIEIDNSKHVLIIKH